MMRQLEPVDCRYGAPMGRTSKPSDNTTAHRFTLQRVRLDRGGYDSGGAYWGLGAPLYWACSDDGTAEEFFRAANRDAAKAVIRADYPNATFYR